MSFDNELPSVSYGSFFILNCSVCMKHRGHRVKSKPTGCLPSAITNKVFGFLVLRLHTTCSTSHNVAVPTSAYHQPIRIIDNDLINDKDLLKCSPERFVMKNFSGHCRVSCFKGVCLCNAVYAKNAFWDRMEFCLQYFEWPSPYYQFGIHLF